MIISHRHKFIFIKTAKTAGTSIEMALSSVCGPEDIITPLNKQEEKFKKERGFRGAQNYQYPIGDYTKMDWLRLLKHRKRIGFHQHISSYEI